jgi:hypothetical protein
MRTAMLSGAPRCLIAVWRSLGRLPVIRSSRSRRRLSASGCHPIFNVPHRRTAPWHRHVGIEEAAACARGPFLAAAWNACSVWRRRSAGDGSWCAADRLCRRPDRYLVLAALVGFGSPGFERPRSARPIGCSRRLGRWGSRGRHDLRRAGVPTRTSGKSRCTRRGA